MNMDVSVYGEASIGCVFGMNIKVSVSDRANFDLDCVPLSISRP